jgi:hypothetical protein
MTPHKITVDVYARWTERPVRYRVYVDSTLLTERDFIWSGSERYVREHIAVQLTPGIHQLRLETVGDHGAVDARNITVNGVASLTDFVTQ